MRRKFPNPVRWPCAKPIALLPAVLVLAGCAAGPNFKPPARPNVAGYTAQPLAATAAVPGVAAGATQHFEAGAEIPGDWWTLFHSAALNTLITEALAHNHDLKAAQAALRVAQEDVPGAADAFAAPCKVVERSPQ
ncbi:MAG: hypothetical protein ACREP0_07860 [Rhodanobacteraceae bacterium]